MTQANDLRHPESPRSGRLPAVVAGVALALLLAFLTFVYLKTRSVDAVEHAAYRTRIHDIRAANAELDEHLLRIRYGHTNHYDDLDQSFSELRTFARELRKTPDFVDAEGQTSIRLLMDELAEELAAKRSLIDRFKSRNAVYQNSLRYVPTIAGELNELLRGQEKRTEAVRHLLERVLLFNLLSDDIHAQEVGQSIKALREWEPTGDPTTDDTVASLLAHVKVILARKPELDTLIPQMLTSTVPDLSDRLARAYATAFARAAERQAYYQSVLYVCCLLFLIAVLLSFRHVRRGKMQLAQRIADRTRELQQTLTFQRAILNSADRSIISTDTEGMIKSFNSTAEKWLGYTADEVIGKLTPAVLHDENEVVERAAELSREMHTDIPPGFDVFVAKARDDIVEEREWTYVRKDGTHFPVTLSVTALRDHGGRITGFLGIANDITQRKLVEEEAAHNRAQSEAILSSTVNGIIMIDERGTIEMINPAGERLFGYDAEEVVGQNVNMLMPTPYAGEHDGYLAAYLRTGIAQVIGKGREVEGMRKDGSVFPMWLGVAEMRTASKRRFVGTTQDISELKQAEAELRAAKEAAEQANRTKSQFLANMSHELRTPMNAILGYSEMLQEDAEDEGNDGYVEDLKKIKAAGKHLLGLINDVLDLSKVEAGKIELHLEDVDVSALVRDVSSTVQPLIEKQSNSLEIRVAEDVGTIHSDLTRVRQVLFNLLSNAAKFTEAGTITVSARREPADQGPDCVVFEVADTGIGISEEQMAKLFQPFTQADSSTTRKYGGTGLGLTLCKQFCEMMGGQISVASRKDEGTTFTVTLSTDMREHRRREIASPPAATKRATVLGDVVLVIDDDTAACELSHRMLDKDYHVLTAQSGEEGLALAKQHRPICIVLDVMMPGMDGWAVLAKLKQDPELAKIPVVMQSMVNDRELGFSLGVNDYLVKPIDRNRLLGAVTRHAKGSSDSSILVVEDDDDTRALVVRTLRAEGWQTREASTGVDALRMVDESVPAAIILDLMMPQMNGFEFLEAIKDRRDMDNVPILVSTAKELTADERTQLNGRVREVMQKGNHSRIELAATIRRLTEGASPAADGDA